MIAADRFEQDHAADIAFVDAPLGGSVCRIISPHVTHLQINSGVRDRFERRIGIVECDRERLFTEDLFACCRCGADGSPMKFRWRTDDDRIEFNSIQQRFERYRKQKPGVLQRAPARAPDSDRPPLRAMHPKCDNAVFRHGTSHLTHSDHSEPQLLHQIPPPI